MTYYFAFFDFLHRAFRRLGVIAGQGGASCNISQKGEYCGTVEFPAAALAKFLSFILRDSHTFCEMCFYVVEIDHWKSCKTAVDKVCEN